MNKSEVASYGSIVLYAIQKMSGQGYGYSIIASWMLLHNE